MTITLNIDRGRKRKNYYDVFKHIPIYVGEIAIQYFTIRSFVLVIRADGYTGVYIKYYNVFYFVSYVKRKENKLFTIYVFKKRKIVSYGK